MGVRSFGGSSSLWPSSQSTSSRWNSGMAAHTALAHSSSLADLRPARDPQISAQCPSRCWRSAHVYSLDHQLFLGSEVQENSDREEEEQRSNKKATWSLNSRWTSKPKLLLQVGFQNCRTSCWPPWRSGRRWCSMLRLRLLSHVQVMPMLKRTLQGCRSRCR